MPISGWDPIDPIMNRIQSIRPESALDIGVGTGQWGFMLRNYLDMRYGRIERKNWKLTLDGIEGFQQYRNPAWDYYDNVVIGDAFDVLRNGGRCYDAILMIEVLEHFQKDTGIWVLKKLAEIGRHVFVSYANMEQGAFMGNSFEVHRSVWTDEEILTLLPNAEVIHKTGVGKFFYWKKGELNAI